MPHNPLRRYAELQDEFLTRQAARSLRAFVEQGLARARTDDAVSAELAY